MYDRKNPGTAGSTKSDLKNQGANNNNNQPTLPAISLPKGGGAIRGIGEKFGANPVTGTASVSIPIFTSPGRSGFGPSLSLSYDSGSGNGPFGFGWNLSVPSITRKTDKGLPLYRDGAGEEEESDVFILSGSEDLVPVLKQDPNGNWIRDEVERNGQMVRRYRPRIEGLFARIERWTNTTTGETHWRSISRDNITTLYGKTTESRISDPDDPLRTFSWLICESYDDKGNAIIYEYVPEDSSGVDLSAAHEKNRSEKSRSANRYLKRIKYGNLPSRLVQPDLSHMNWMFEVVFDYGEHDQDKPTPNDDSRKWLCRHDPFSSYRAGFEVRTYRLCQRVLMFHHFPDEEGVGEDCLVRSTDFVYRDIRNNPEDLKKGHPVASFIASVTQSGYKRHLPDGSSSSSSSGGYLKRSLPPVEFEYSQATINEEIKEIDSESLQNMPYGIDGMRYQWVDLDGEGVSGILTEQGDAWFYKPNLGGGTFGPIEGVAFKPSLGGDLSSSEHKLLDLAGDGQLDLVELNSPTPGFYERNHDQNWESFVPFESLPNIDWNDPNTRFVDLTGDGHADILVTENEALKWYPSLAERGFGSSSTSSSSSATVADLTPRSQDEERGPRLVFSDSTQSIYLADMSGDGLTDLVRIRNGEVCYWPNLGYGRFGSKVTMDNSPWFEAPDMFDQSRIRLADIDGSGVTDIIYIGGRDDGVSLYFNQSGNSWSKSVLLNHFPHIDNISSVTALDLLGNGTACLVWSSPLLGDSHRPMRYVDLMGGEQKPHLLISIKNNMGAETHVEYASSTKFYLADKAAGKPWVTRLPFPVHVVERVKTYDHISRNFFVSHYTYHHGYFDGVEREFRGFGRVEQYDTEEFGTFSSESEEVLSFTGENVDASSHVPAVLTKTWFHTGIYLGRDHVSNFFAGLHDGENSGEYYREPGLSYPQSQELLLADTKLPDGLSLEEEREACRALKGSMLRQEVYALDNTPKAEHPYTVTEQNFTIQRLQPQGDNSHHHAVFFTHACEAINYRYERRLVPVLNGQILDESMVDSTDANIKWLPDPRVQHAVTLEVDSFGNVLKSVAIGYGRRMDAPDPALLPEDHEKQRLIHITCTENIFTIPVLDEADAYRTPLPAETCTYELRKPQQEKSANGLTKLYEFNVLLGYVNQAGDGSHDIAYEDIDFIKAKEAATNDPGEDNKYFRRLIEHMRTLYRPDDLGAAEDDAQKLLPLRSMQPLALTGESYKLAFTAGLLSQVFQRAGQPLLVTDPNDPDNMLGGEGPDRGGYVSSQQLKAEGKFPNTDPDNHWWIPTGRVFYSPRSEDTAAEELDYASQHFFLPHRYRDPFHIDTVSTESLVTFDDFDLLMLESRDALGNRVTVGERLPNGQTDPNKPGNDYRVLQPRLVTDPNRNRMEVKFDALGMVAGTAVKGKDDSEGDTLSEFEPDLEQAQVDEFYDVSDPHVPGLNILKGATTCIIYDLHRFHRTQQAHPEDPKQWLPVYAATLARQTHVSDLSSSPADGLKIQIGFSYSDGFGREIQKKIQAEPGSVVEGGPVVSPRWVGSGWTIFNNKGKPVRQYEPFFSQLLEKRHRFEFGMQVGVSPIVFYDPVERVVTTLNPNHTYEKVVFDPWQQVSYDVNDTVAAHSTQTGDPRTDPDIHGYVAKYFAATLNDPTTWQTWFEQRQSGTIPPEEKAAALKAAAHADTPIIVYFDTLGRPFLTMAHNRFKRNGVIVDETYATHVKLDIEGNQREVRDAIVQNDDAQGRIVMRYDYDMLGNRIHQLSMEAGAVWMLNDVVGKPIRAWDSRGHTFRIEYDPLRRPLRSFVTGANPSDPSQELLTERMVYGEQHPEDELRNLRGRLYLLLEQAGMVRTEIYDFKGNPLRTSRGIAKQYKQAVDWRAVDDDDPITLEAALPPVLEEETFSSRTTYNALNRPVQVIAPHSDHPGARRNVIQAVYNEANLLERMHVWLDHPTEPTDLLDPAIALPSPVGVRNIDYDAKGQRKRIDYDNGASTFYDYDPLTFRLIHLLTARNAVAFPDDCAPTTPSGWPGCQVQNLYYTYDPVGNIIHIRDDAQQTIFFHHKRVEPSSEYTYDAIYRLIEATGREHLGQVEGAPIPHSHNDAPRVGILHPNDGRAMGTYIERYIYDAVGNILEMQHYRSNHPSNPGWTRRYAYDETSLIEDGTAGTMLKTSNRLSRTTVGNGGNPALEQYLYDDDNGNMIRMPHLAGVHPAPNMRWDYRDQLCQTDLGGGGTAYYVYDASSQRVRKVWEKSLGLIEERIYLGAFEIFRRRNGAGVVKLERETLHIMDDRQRIALVETRTIDSAGDDPAPPQLIRYQFDNHLSSVNLELDHQARIISYEEYTPYGSTTYQAVRSQTDTPKRYRYTGKERDEESGLNYHRARFYAPWLGRWTSADPIGIEGDINMYEYTRSNPVKLVDIKGTQPVSSRQELLTSLNSHIDKDKNKIIDWKEANEFIVSDFGRQQVRGDNIWVHWISLSRSVGRGEYKYEGIVEGAYMSNKFYYQLLTARSTGVGNLVPGNYRTLSYYQEFQNQMGNLQNINPITVHMVILLGATGGNVDSFLEQITPVSNMLTAGGSMAQHKASLPHSQSYGDAAKSGRPGGAAGSGDVPKLRSNRGPFNARNVGQGGDMNCSECVVNWEASAREGQRVREMRRGGGGVTYLHTHIARLRDVGANPTSLPGRFFNKSDLISAVQKFPPGTRFTVFAESPKVKTGHYFAGQIDSKGLANFIETQRFSSSYWLNSSWKDYDFQVIIHNP